MRAGEARWRVTGLAGALCWRGLAGCGGLVARRAICCSRSRRATFMIDLSAIELGRSGRAELLVGPEHTAPRVGSGRIAVLATPVMINLIEAAALAAVEPLLPPGHQSLGIHL